MTTTEGRSLERSARAWHREPTFWAVTVLALATYGLRLTALPVFGEETRRGVIAREMLETGDWIVPRVQGVPRLSRPPLQNWLIAAASLVTGSVDVWAVRIPSVVATLLTAGLAYVAGHRCSGARVATLAGCSYVAMIQVLEFGRLGETEAVFTLFVAGSLLVWLLGDLSGVNPWKLWPVCYLLVAAGTLTKGLQAPVYFCGAVAITLILRRRWRELVSPAHLTGAALGLACVGVWQVAFMTTLGWDEGWKIYFLNVAGRFDGTSGDTFLGHFTSFPFETFAMMLPGSAMMLAALRADVRARLADHRPTVQFLVASLAWAFVFVWLPPGARTRYFMPLMPCAAVLTGLIGDAALRSWSSERFYRWTLGLSAACAAMYVGPVLSFQARRCDDIAEQVAALKARLPAEAKLVSLQQLHHGFLFYYRDAIPLLPWPEDESDVPDDVEYFAVHTYRRDVPTLPFDWERIDVVSCDRFRKAEAWDRIHIGRRVRGGTEVAGSQRGRGL